MRRAPWAETAVLAVTVAWGLSFVVIPHALEDAGFVTLTALRMTVGTVAGLVLLRPRLRGVDARTWRYGLVGGVLLTIAYLLQTAGMRTAGSGDSAFLTAFYVTLVPILDAAVHRRRPAPRDLAALAVATAGIALIVVSLDDARGLHLGWGETLVAVSAFFWAAQIVAVGRVAKTADPATLSILQIAVIAVVSLAAVPFAGERPVQWSWTFGGSVFFLGYVTCTLAFAVQAWAQRKIPSTRIAVLFCGEPVFAALAGWYFRDEDFGPRKFAGAALVAVAVALTMVPSARRADDGDGVTSAG